MITARRSVSELKERLQNWSISLEFTREEAKAEAKPYTDREKFDRMAEENPELLNLKNRLDLDFGA